MKTIYTILIFLLFPFFISSQTLSPKVLSVAGRNVSNNGYSLSWTLGEPIASTLKNTNYFLTQGFQQPYYKLQAITENDQENNILFYPNPAKDFLIVDVNTPNQIFFKAQLIDVLGKCISTFNFGNSKQQIIDLKNVLPGIYFLRITDENLNYQKIIKINKI